MNWIHILTFLAVWWLMESCYESLHLLSVQLHWHMSMSYVFYRTRWPTIQHQKQLATESGRIKIRTFVDRCQHFKMCGQSAPHCVCLASTPNFNKTSPALWSNLHSHHFVYINNPYDIQVGHKSCDQCLIRNIKHWGTGRKYFLPIAVSCILRSNHWSVRWSNLPTSPLN